MLVRCRSNRGADLPSSCLDDRSGFRVDTEFPVTPGRTYAVHAITIFLGHPWYYILNDDRLRWPVWAPGPLFDVDDPALPDGWHVAYHRFRSGNANTVISFPEWADDPHFYERLVDGDEESLRIFDLRRGGYMPSDTTSDAETDDASISPK